ncbi:MAG TPA: HAD family hydrolase [Elusimicrobiales bacterium]|nr:HAD family hydrolase [Elusimicrobiales bacterium]
MRAWSSPAAGPASPAAFLDRDGTLNRNRHGVYVTRPGQLELYARVPAALKLLAKKGYLLIVVTNQSGIARGYMTEARSRAIQLKLVAQLKRRGVKLDGVYFCPHAPDGGCACRKPAPGLLKEAAADHRIDMRRSFVAGDKACDLQLARRAGIKGYLVMTGGGRAAAAGSAAPGFRDLLSLALAVPDHSGKGIK